MPSVRPWGSRLLEILPVAPVWGGLAIAALCTVAYTAHERASGHLARLASGELDSTAFRAQLSLMLLLGYFPAARLYLERWTRRHLEQIRPLLATGAPAESADRPSRLAGALGAAAFLLLFLVPITPPSAYIDPAVWRAGFWIPALCVPLVGWQLGCFGFELVRDALRVSRLAGWIESIDLLERRPLAPFVQQGLRGWLLVVLLLAIAASIYLAPGDDVALQSALNVVTWSAVGVAALVIPVRGVQRRVREEKREQLARLRARINTDREALLAGKVEADPIAARLPGLLALEARLEAVHEWPFDAPAMLRFALYLLVGIGSWLGAAAVERALDLALG